MYNFQSNNNEHNTTQRRQQRVLRLLSGVECGVLFGPARRPPQLLSKGDERDNRMHREHQPILSLLALRNTRVCRFSQVSFQVILLNNIQPGRFIFYYLFYFILSK